MEPIDCNKDNMRLFIALLRSGELEQGKGALRERIAPRIGRVLGTPDEPDYYYCCLGVATECAVRNGLVLNDIDEAAFWTIKNRNLRLQAEQPDFSIREAGWTYEFDHPIWSMTSGYLAFSVQEWLGINDQDPFIFMAVGGPFEQVVKATHANDTLEWSFLQIADAFEALYLPEDVTPSAPAAN